MHKTQSQFGGVLTASILAGPLTILITSVAAAYRALPHAIAVNTISTGMLVMMLFSIIPGLIVGGVLNGLGTLVMQALSDYFAWARNRFGWAIAGGLLGAFLTWCFHLTGEGPEILFGLVATSTICGWMCHNGVSWPADSV